MDRQRSGSGADQEWIRSGSGASAVLSEALTMVNPQLLTCVLLLLLSSCGGWRDRDERVAEQTILEMLHIDRVSASHEQAQPHPYMRRIYQKLPALDFSGADGTLMQSFRSVHSPPDAPPGWIWFNLSSVQASMLAAELVLYRKTLHPRPVSVTVTLHATTAALEAGRDGPALEEQLLRLEQRSASGYDVFDVSAVLAQAPLETVGFQLRYTDESGSLVLHDALTQSLYALTRGLQTEPLLVLYQQRPQHLQLGLQ